MRAALCEGYAIRRLVKPEELDLFLLLRGVSYVGWITDRLHEPVGAERSARLVDSAVAAAQDYLKRRR